MEQEEKLPGRLEWPALSLNGLLETRSAMQTKFFNMRGINASFAGQYGKFISELDALIEARLRSDGQD